MIHCRINSTLYMKIIGKHFIFKYVYKRKVKEKRATAMRNKSKTHKQQHITHTQREREKA